MKKQMKRNKKGFTLVEMIVVIAIIGVLAAMMVPSLLGYIERANTSNNRAAATNVGRMAQAVLAELNDPTQPAAATSYTQTANASGLLAFTGSSDFEKGFNDMIKDDKFKGTVEINIEKGKLNYVRYSQGSSIISTSTTVSTKDTGYYPEN